jgi:hypothetical protein
MFDLCAFTWAVDNEHVPYGAPFRKQEIAGMKKIVLASAAILFLSLGPTAFSQQDATGQSAAGSGRGAGSGIRAACAGDLQKLCPNAQDRDSRRQCLTDNKAQLSSECSAAIAARSEGAPK